MTRDVAGTVASKRPERTAESGAQISPRQLLAVPVAIAVASRVFSVALILAINQIGNKWPNPFVTWDAQWYLSIVKTGYHAGVFPKGGHDVAFYPAWPLLIKICTLGFLDPEIVAPVLANVLAVAAIVLVWLSLRKTFGERVATDGTLLLAFSPAAYTLSMAYTEPLFILVTCLALLAGTSRWRILPSAFGMLLRVTGAAVLAATFVKALTVRGPARWNLVAAVVAGGLVFVAWFAAVGYITHDALGFLRYGSSSWMSLSGIWAMADAVANPAHRTTSLLRIAVVVLAAVGAWLTLRRDLELGTFAAAAALVPLLPGGGLASSARYAMVAFPAWAAISEKIGRKSSLVLALIFAVVQVLLVKDSFAASYPP